MLVVDSSYQQPSYYSPLPYYSSNISSKIYAPPTVDTKHSPTRQYISESVVKAQYNSHSSTNKSRLSLNAYNASDIYHRLCIIFFCDETEVPQIASMTFTEEGVRVVNAGTIGEAIVPSYDDALPNSIFLPRSLFHQYELHPVTPPAPTLPSCSLSSSVNGATTINMAAISPYHQVPISYTPKLDDLHHYQQQIYINFTTLMDFLQSSLASLDEDKTYPLHIVLGDWLYISLQNTPTISELGRAMSEFTDPALKRFCIVPSEFLSAVRPPSPAYGCVPSSSSPSSPIPIHSHVSYQIAGGCENYSSFSSSPVDSPISMLNYGLSTTNATKSMDVTPIVSSFDQASSTDNMILMLLPLNATQIKVSNLLPPPTASNNYINTTILSSSSLSSLPPSSSINTTTSTPTTTNNISDPPPTSSSSSSSPSSFSPLSPQPQASRKHPLTPTVPTTPPSSYVPTLVDSLDKDGTMMEGPARKRLKTTSDQINVLEEWFKQDPLPPRKTREKMVAQLEGVSLRQLEVWFQNRRAKEKKSGVAVVKPRVSPIITSSPLSCTPSHMFTTTTTPTAVVNGVNHHNNNNTNTNNNNTVMSSPTETHQAVPTSPAHQQSSPSTPSTPSTISTPPPFHFSPPVIPGLIPIATNVNITPSPASTPHGGKKRGPKKKPIPNLPGGFSPDSNQPYKVYHYAEVPQQSDLFTQPPVSFSRADLLPSPSHCNFMDGFSPLTATEFPPFSIQSTLHLGTEDKDALFGDGGLSLV